MKRFLKGLGLVILNIILFVAISSLLLLLPIRKVVAEDTIKDIILDFDIESAVNNNDDVKNEVKNLFKPIYDEAKEIGIDEEVVNKLINSKEVKELIGTATGNIIESALTGKNKKIISDNDIEKLINKAFENINKNSEHKLSKTEQDKILNAVKENINIIQEAIPDNTLIEDNLNSNQKSNLKIVRFILSDKLLFYILGIIIIAILGILILDFKKGKWIKDIAITTLISASLSLIATVIITLLSKILLKDARTIMNIAKRFLNFSLVLSIVILVIMILILISYVILKKKKEPKEAID